MSKDAQFSSRFLPRNDASRCDEIVVVDAKKSLIMAVTSTLPIFRCFNWGILCKRIIKYMKRGIPTVCKGVAISNYSHRATTSMTQFHCQFNLTARAYTLSFSFSLSILVYTNLGTRKSRQPTTSPAHSTYPDFQNCHFHKGICAHSNI